LPIVTQRQASANSLSRPIRHRAAADEKAIAPKSRLCCAANRRVVDRPSNFPAQVSVFEQVTGAGAEVFSTVKWPKQCRIDVRALIAYHCICIDAYAIMYLQCYI